MTEDFPFEGSKLFRNKTGESLHTPKDSHYPLLSGDILSGTPEKIFQAAASSQTPPITSVLFPTEGAYEPTQELSSMAGILHHHTPLYSLNCLTESYFDTIHDHSYQTPHHTAHYHHLW